MIPTAYNDEAFRARLRKLREAANLTQREVAEHAGITKIYYQSIEAGRRSNVSIRVIGQIAAVYGMSLSEFFAESSDARIFSRKSSSASVKFLAGPDTPDNA
jgi:transcriptional regulator with XRE-family HTH domain